jgi:hypothetical protein
MHDLAHEYLDHKHSMKPKNIREIEAKGTAYVICDFFDLPTKAPTYLALHAQATSKDILKHGPIIHESAHVIISYLLEHLGYNESQFRTHNE